MKRILMATAAIAAGAIAAPQVASAQSVSAGNADITLGGLARFGVGYNDGRAEELIIISRFRLNINAAVELPSGVRLAATVRGQADENAATGQDNPLTFGGARYQISVGGLRVRIGNISGVFDDGSTIRPFADTGLEGAIGMVSNFGFPGPAFGNDSGDNGLLVNYDVGDLSLAVSYLNGAHSGNGIEDVQFGIGYSFGDFNVGAVIGDQETAAGVDNGDFWLVSFDGSFGAFGFNAVVGENSTGGAAVDAELAYGFALNYDVNEDTNIQFIYSDGGGTTAAPTDAQVALGFTHQLGSGSRIQGFIGEDAGGNTRADFGVRFNF